MPLGDAGLETKVETKILHRPNAAASRSLEPVAARSFSLQYERL
jgi:hypothetical protein